MKKIVGLLLFLGGSFSATSQIHAQTAYAAKDNHVITSNDIKIKSHLLKADNLSGVAEIRKHILHEVKVDESIYNYVGDIEVILEVKIDQNGLITSYKLEDNVVSNLDEQVHTAMKHITSVEPIVINGKARAKTIMFPIVFKS